jgi:hypothetical protein
VVGRSCRTRGPSGGLTAAAARGAAPPAPAVESLNGRADVLYVVNDALGSLLLRANEVIDQVPMSACGRYCCKSLFGVMNQNFLEPLMRLARGDVRDHIALHKRLRTSVVALKSTQQQRSPKIDFREIFRVVRFSTFATWGNSGIEPDKGEGISFPGKYGASLIRPCNDGERQWNFMSDLTCR